VRGPKGRTGPERLLCQDKPKELTEDGRMDAVHRLPQQKLSFESGDTSAWSLSVLTQTQKAVPPRC